MILTAVPHDVGADLGRAYNEVMRRVQDDDWVCFLDHDAMFTTRTWFRQLSEVVEEHPDAGLFSVMTNRVGNPQQELRGVDKDNHDVAYHRRIGKQVAEGRHEGVVDLPLVLDMDYPGWNWLAGVVLLTSKKAWSQVMIDEKVGFPEGYFLGLDNFYHKEQRRLGNKCYLLTRVYVYHWFRAGGDDTHVQAGRSYKP